jgi:hypothetical protein
VIRVMPALDPHPPAREAARINSQTCSTPLWALTGLKVRDTLHAAVDGAAPPPVKMATHPSVLQWTHAFPAGTAWCQRGNATSWIKLLMAVMLLALLLAMMGWAQLSPQGAFAPLDQLGAAFEANQRFQAWQLSLPPTEWLTVAKSFQRPGTALLLDLLLIATWAHVLAPWVCRAFARHAGLIHVGEPPSAWLNRAGWALPLAVGADLLEDLLSWLALVAVGADSALILPLRLLLLGASLAKWVGLVGVAALILTSLLSRRQMAAPRAAAT